MVEVGHYQSSPTFPFDDVDNPGLRQDCFDRGIFKQLKKYVGRHQSVAGCGFQQLISFCILGPLNIFYSESFDVILYSSDKS
jgi:hypothetical protein